MLTALLSDFYNIFKPSYQLDSIQPILSTILTVITFTILLYSAQTVTTNIHAYAQSPQTFRNKIVQNKNCSIFSQSSLGSLCRGLTEHTVGNYKSDDKFSFEQDLQSPIK